MQAPCRRSTCKAGLALQERYEQAEARAQDLAKQVEQLQLQVELLQGERPRTSDVHLPAQNGALGKVTGRQKNTGTDTAMQDSMRDGQVGHSASRMTLRPCLLLTHCTAEQSCSGMRVDRPVACRVWLWTSGSLDMAGRISIHRSPRPCMPVPFHCTDVSDSCRQACSLLLECLMRAFAKAQTSMHLWLKLDA